MREERNNWEIERARATPKNRRSRAGLTLLEVLLVIFILGLLASLVNPRVLNVYWWSYQTDACTRARILNTAMGNYYATVTNAQTNWTTASSTSNQYLLLYNAGLLNNQPSTFSAFQGTSGYTLTLPSALTGTTTVKDSSGNVVTYN